MESPQSARKALLRSFGELLRQHRLAAGLAQEMLAERARLSVQTISALERGSRRKPYLDTIALLAEALDLSSADRAELERAALRRSDAQPAGDWYGARSPLTPHQGQGIFIDSEAVRPVPSFSGRAEKLKEIAAALSIDGAIVAVHGLGGVGKSSIAREYARRKRDECAVVWWLNAQTEDGIIEAMLRLGSLFTSGLDQTPDRRAAAQRVIGSMLSGLSKPTLLIFDNLEDERLLRTWAPRTGLRVLVTTRNAVLTAGVTAISLDTWPLETAVDYLQRESGRTDLSDEDAQAIAEALGTLPLALSHAAAALRGMRMLTPVRYLQRIVEHLKSAPRDAESPNSVFATFNTSIAQAEHQAAGAAAILSFAALFAPDGIPEELFRQPTDMYLADHKPNLFGDTSMLDLRSTIADDLRLDEALGALDRLSLLRFSEPMRSYNIHRLVQLAARDMILEDALAWRKCAVGVADAAFPEVEFSTWPQCEHLLPHARAALEALPDDVAFLPAGRLANRCAVYLRERGNYAAAEPLQARALAIRENSLGPDHPDVASSLHGLASLYRRQGRYKEAEPLYRRTLAIREKALGPHHPRVAMTLNGLAFVYQVQGRCEEAELLHKRALAIVEKALGANHPDLAESMNHLAIVYEVQGRYDKAELLYARALAIKEEALGPDNPRVAMTLHNLAVVCAVQGRYGEAEHLHTRALAIFEKALGPDHPDVAENLNHLALVYRGQGRYEEAERLHIRALAIRERALGQDHPDVATSLSDLAALCEARGRLEDGEPLLARALAIREKTLGPDHTLTKAARKKLRAVLSRTD